MVIIQLDVNNRCVSANCNYKEDDKTIEYEFETDEERMNFFSNITDYVYQDGKIVLDEQPSTEDEKAEQETTLEQMMFASARASFLVELPDNEAVKIPLCYPSWKSYIGKSMDEGQRFEHEGNLWKSRQAIPQVLENQPPSVETASLYERIDVEHTGTVDDPIPYDQTMTVYKDKYYIEDDIIYKCLEDSGQPLYATCASLVGNYFELIE